MTTIVTQNMEKNIYLYLVHTVKMMAIKSANKQSNKHLYLLNIMDFYIKCHKYCVIFLLFCLYFKVFVKFKLEIFIFYLLKSKIWKKIYIIEYLYIKKITIYFVKLFEIKDVINVCLLFVYFEIFDYLDFIEKLLRFFLFRKQVITNNWFLLTIKIKFILDIK